MAEIANQVGMLIGAFLRFAFLPFALALFFLWIIRRAHLGRAESLIAQFLTVAVFVVGVAVMVAAFHY